MLQLGRGERETRNLGLIELNFSPILRPSFEFHLKNLFPLKIVLKKILFESSMGFVGGFCDWDGLNVLNLNYFVKLRHLAGKTCINNFNDGKSFN